MRLRGKAAIAIAMMLSMPFAEASRANESAAIAASFATLAAASLTCTAVASGYDHPEGTSEFARKGAYLDLAGSFALPTFESNVEDSLTEDAGGIPIGVEPDTALGVNGAAGYRCHRFFSAEVQAEWLSGFDGDVSYSGNGKIGTMEIEPLVVTTNFRVHYPAGRWQPFMLVGVGIMSAKVDVNEQAALGLSDSDTLTGLAMRFGGGLDFYATKHVVLNAGVDYVLPFSEVQDLNYLSIGWGVAYRF